MGGLCKTLHFIPAQVEGPRLGLHKEPTLTGCHEHNLSSAIMAQGRSQAPAVQPIAGQVSIKRASVQPPLLKQTPHGPLLQVKGLEKKASRKAHLERLLGTATGTCLSGPFERAAAAEDRNALSSLAHSWTTYIATVQVCKLIWLPAPQAWPKVRQAT